MAHRPHHPRLPHLPPLAPHRQGTALSHCLWLAPYSPPVEFPLVLHWPKDKKEHILDSKDSYKSSLLSSLVGSYLWYIFIFNVVPNRLKSCSVNFVHSPQQYLYKEKGEKTIWFAKVLSMCDISHSMKVKTNLSLCFCEGTIWIWVELRMRLKISHWDTKWRKKNICYITVTTIFQMPRSSAFNCSVQKHFGLLRLIQNAVILQTYKNNSFYRFALYVVPVKL